MGSYYNESFAKPSSSPWGARAASPLWGRYFASSPATFTIMGICILLAIPYLFFPRFNNYLAVAAGLSYVEPWRLLSAAFAHYGTGHLILNMWMLFLLGPPLERSLGSWRFVWLYLFAALGSSVFVETLQVYSFVEVSYTAGASGALFGLFAALAVLHKRMQTNLRMVLLLLGINFAYGLIFPGISWEGHLGGAIFGGLFAAVVLLGSPLPGSSREVSLKKALWQVPLAMLLTAGLIVIHFWIYSNLIF
ncbi:rhomboid family intramembrane serine protease [Actinomycetaceae bacterium TAE3-ERU4]|nr:rhomboid family intramembrane serine protease [Actinomycetaceae bacterium TAE3-ERU4]